MNFNCANFSYKPALHSTENQLEKLDNAVPNETSEESIEEDRSAKGMSINLVHV